jgi:hypothetical protein
MMIISSSTMEIAAPERTDNTHVYIYSLVYTNIHTCIQVYKSIHISIYIYV